MFPFMNTKIQMIFNKMNMLILNALVGKVIKLLTASICPLSVLLLALSSVVRLHLYHPLFFFFKLKLQSRSSFLNPFLPTYHVLYIRH